MLKPRRPAWMRALDLGSMCQSPCSSYDDYAASQDELLRDKQDEHSASIRMRKGRRMRDEGRA
jgi:hypothetical protein